MILSANATLMAPVWAPLMMPVAVRVLAGKSVGVTEKAMAEVMAKAVMVVEILALPSRKGPETAPTEKILFV